MAANRARKEKHLRIRGTVRREFLGVPEDGMGYEREWLRVGIAHL